MGKGVRRSSKKEEQPIETASPGGVAGVVVEAREALRELVLNAGFAVFAELLEEDREAVCGPRYSREGEREAYRHGSERGRLVFGGRQVRFRRPRVRTVGGEELALPSWEAMKDQDPLEERAVQQVLCGVSTRKYDASLEELSAGEESAGTSKSSVSRRFVARTRGQIQAFLSRPLGDLDLPVLMLDGTTLGRHLLVVALGIDRDGKKHVLGVVEGTTESAAVCRSLLRMLIDRGLPVERRRLVVIDGSKGLAAALKSTFGEWIVIQRCRVHKARNVMEHLPKHLRPWFQVRLRKIWKLEDADAAQRRLLALAKEIETEYPGAAGSLREGLEHTLTVNRLGLSGALLRTLRSTNPIENLQGRIKDTARNVKRWRNGSMVLRWAVTGLMAAETRFRRIRGYNDLDQLEAGLEQLIEIELDKEALVA